MNIERAWTMPNKDTFSIAPIRALLEGEMTGGLWIDPFAGLSRIATITNDLNPDLDTSYHLDALDFLKMFKTESVQGVLYDPPYSVRQVSECYKRYGYPVTQEMTRSSWYTLHREQIRRIVIPGGK